MKNYFILISALTILVACSRNSPGPVVLTELGKDTLIQIKTKKTYPTTLKISIKGYATDTFILSGARVKGGKIDTFWHTDWYTKNITINYTAYKAKQGKLTINCILY